MKYSMKNFSSNDVINLTLTVNVGYFSTEIDTYVYLCNVMTYLVISKLGIA